MCRNEQPESWWARWPQAAARYAVAAIGATVRRLGGPKLLSVPVSAAMLTRVATAHPQQPLDEVAQLFVTGRVVHVPVIDRGRPVSVITRGDVATGLASAGPHGTVASAPSHQAVAVTAIDSLRDVLDRLEAAPDAVAVVFDHGGAVGVLTAETVAQYLDDAARRNA